MGKGLDVPLAQRPSPFSPSLIFILSHTHTQTPTYFHICVGCRECKGVKKKEAPLNGEHCPGLCASYMHNFRLQYNTCVQRNISFKCWKLISFDLILNVEFISITVDFYSASLKDFKDKAGMFMDSCGVLFIPFYCQLTTELATRS